LILCFCQTALSRQDVVVVNAFAFVMVQGANPTIQLLIRWLESRTGVIISHCPFGFTPSQVAQCMTSWIILALQQQEQMQLRQQLGSVVEDYEEDDMVSATTTTTATANSFSPFMSSHTHRKRRREPKPLQLTFAVPEVVANKGLDTISLSILPTDLLTLYRNIEDRRPSNLASTGQDDSETLGANPNAPTPILTALQCYMTEVFHIDIRSFPLIRASSSAAMLSCDGRCKVHDESFLTLVLDDIKDLVQKRFSNSSTLQKKGDAEQQS
jgi:hypothetical protein